MGGIDTSQNGWFSIENCHTHHKKNNSPAFGALTWHACACRNSSADNAEGRTDCPQPLQLRGPMACIVGSWDLGKAVAFQTVFSRKETKNNCRLMWKLQTLGRTPDLGDCPECLEILQISADTAGPQLRGPDQDRQCPCQRECQNKCQIEWQNRKSE